MIELEPREMSPWALGFTVLNNEVEVVIGQNWAFVIMGVLLACVTLFIF